VHHIVFDNWSKSVVSEELKQCYYAHRLGRRDAFQRPAADYGYYVSGSAR
jgi:hypothetical protein